MEDVTENAIAATVERGIGLDETFRLLVPAATAADPALVSRLVTTYRDLYGPIAEQHTTLFPGWTETLEALAFAGVHTVIVSNKGIKAVNTALARFGIDRFVTLVIGDTEGVPKKPDPAPFERLVFPAFQHVARSRALVVGDTDADILFAQNIGGHSCWARYGYGSEATCTALGPHYTIESPREIQRIVGCSDPSAV
jgi:phosphoglycolate phosphatase